MRSFLLLSLVSCFFLSPAFAVTGEQKALQKAVDSLNHRTVAQLVSVLDGILNAKDKEFFKSYMRAHAGAVMPKITLVRDRIQIMQDGEVINLQVTDFKAPVVRVNSQTVDLSFDLPLQQRLERIDEILNSTRAGEFQLLPSAHANPVVIGGLVVLMGAGYARDWYFEDYLADIKERLTVTHDLCVATEKKSGAEQPAADPESEKRNESVRKKCTALMDHLQGPDIGIFLEVFSAKNLKSGSLSFSHVKALTAETADCFKRLSDKHLRLSEDDFQTVKTKIAPIELDSWVKFHHGYLNPDPNDPMTTR